MKGELSIAKTMIYPEKKSKGQKKNELTLQTKII